MIGGLGLIYSNLLCRYFIPLACTHFTGLVLLRFRYLQFLSAYNGVIYRHIEIPLNI